MLEVHTKLWCNFCKKLLHTGDYWVRDHLRHKLPELTVIEHRINGADCCDECFKSFKLPPDKYKS